jgi:cold shock CspA family protein
MKTQIGTVDRIRRKQFCFLKTDAGETFYSHVKFFLNPNDMKEGQKVAFTPVETLVADKNPTAMNVRAV